MGFNEKKPRIYYYYTCQWAKKETNQHFTVFFKRIQKILNWKNRLLIIPVTSPQEPKNVSARVGIKDAVLKILTSM